MEGPRIKGSMVLVVIILATGLLVMLLLLNYSKSINKAKVNTSYDVKTVEQSTTRVEDITTDRLPDDNTTSNNSVELNVVDFQASLEAITYYSGSFEGNYKNEIYYSGAMFNLVCTKYDEAKNKCVQGSGSMNTGQIVLPIYTYDNEEDDITTRLYDLYIIVRGDYIIISNNISGKKPGQIKIYDKQGNFKSEIKNVVTGYYQGNELLNQFYPMLSEDGQELFYQVCANNSVKATGIKLDNPGVEIDAVNIDGTRCY